MTSLRAPAPGAFLALMALLAAFAFAPAARAATPTFPALTGRVVDDAHLLSPEVQADLTQKLAALEAGSGRQLVVVTLPSLQGYDIQDYGYQLGRAWGIGQKKENNGALLLVAPNERKVRIEAGYGLEPILTDAVSSVILQQRVLPKFRSGDVAGGIVDGTQAIIDLLAMPEDQAKAKAAQTVAQAPRARAGGNPLAPIIIGLVVFWVLGSILRGGRRRGGMGWLLPMMILNSSWGRGRGDDDWGGGFGGGGGGGGFSGGGGSFGGGGSSGSW